MSALKRVTKSSVCKTTSNPIFAIGTTSSDKLEEYLFFLEYDLRDSADSHRDRAETYYHERNTKNALTFTAAADRLDEPADEVETITPEALTSYAKARQFGEDLDGPDFIHCSMTMEIGVSLNPQDINELCRIYANAVECVRHSRFAKEGDMADFWTEFTAATRA